jgi:hypothetical protein
VRSFLVAVPSLPSNQARRVFLAEEVQARDRELAGKLEKELSNCGAGAGFECCGHADETIKEVVRVLREGGGKK